MGPLYLITLYVHQELVLSTEATMFFTVAETLGKLSTFYFEVMSEKRLMS